MHRHFVDVAGKKICVRVAVSLVLPNKIRTGLFARYERSMTKVENKEAVFNIPYRSVKGVRWMPRL